MRSSKRERAAGQPCALRGLTLAAVVGTLASVAEAACPPAGAEYVIKGFAGDTRVTAKGSAPDRRGACFWRTEDGRDLWWNMGGDVKPAPPRPAGYSATGSGALVPGSVYRCSLPGIGLFTGAYFGIVDGSTYRNVDGKRGSYTFDSRTGVLRLVSGPGKGLSYQRQSGGNFRVLDERGKITGGNCALNKGLSINGRW
ncbi:MAG: hypothetical protein JNL19_02430 [Burkholderiales bacterium]|nr:hypothetical protein [Burkholderiales bacterium]